MHQHPDQEVYRFCPACSAPLEERFVEGADRLVCSDCSRIHYLDPKVAAACIPVTSSGEIVLVRRAIPPVDTWTYPGGYVDRGEDPRLAARREAAEEAGLEVEVGEFLGLYNSPGSIVLVLVYRGKVADYAPCAGPECREVKLFHPHDIPWQQLSFDSTRQALREFLR